MTAYTKLTEDSDQCGYMLTFWECPHCKVIHHEAPSKLDKKTKCPSCNGGIVVCTSWDTWINREDEE